MAQNHKTELINRKSYQLRMPSARAIARLLTTERASKGDQTARLMVAIETASPAIVKARNLLDRFAALISAKSMTSSTHGSAMPQRARCPPSQKALRLTKLPSQRPSSSRGPMDRLRANKLKLVKRQMYGRAKVDLLRARLMETG